MLNETEKPASSTSHFFTGTSRLATLQQPAAHLVAQYQQVAQHPLCISAGCLVHLITVVVTGNATPGFNASNHTARATIPWDALALAYVTNPEWFGDERCFEMQLVMKTKVSAALALICVSACLCVSSSTRSSLHANTEHCCRKTCLYSLVNIGIYWCLVLRQTSPHQLCLLPQPFSETISACDRRCQCTYLAKRCHAMHVRPISGFSVWLCPCKLHNLKHF